MRFLALESIFYLMFTSPENENVAAAHKAGKCLEEEERHYFPLKRCQGEVTRQTDRERPLPGNCWTPLCPLQLVKLRGVILHG